MPVPLLTFGLVCLRAGLRPVNKTITKAFKNSNMHPMGYKFFVGIGNSSFRGEQYLKKKMQIDEQSAEE